MKQVPLAMAIAGSDSGSGAGIQADLKTFAALGVYGTCAITAVTAQNTLGVTAVHEVPVDIIRAQIQAVTADIGVNVVKTGMLFSNTVVHAVAEELDNGDFGPVVVDPVMVAKSGHRLLTDGAIDVLRHRLFKLATVVTPNIFEAEVLTGRSIATVEEARNAAEDIVAMGAKAVVIKGGHLEGPPIDLLYDGISFKEFTGPRVDTVNTHGTGCTFASAIAAGLAKEIPLADAVDQAKIFVTKAMQKAFKMGQGHGPLHHFFMLS